MIAPTDTLRALLQALLGYAATGGADNAWLSSASDELVGALLDLQELRRLVDPRRQRTAILARQIAEADRAMQRSGITSGRMPMLCDRFGLSRAQIYRLISMSHEPRDTSALRSAHEPSRRRGRPSR